MPSSCAASFKEVKFRWDKHSDYTLQIKSLDIASGQHLFVQGKSGIGKTTLLNLISGIHLPSEGEVIVLGKNLAKLSTTKRDAFRASELGIIFQEFNLLPFLSLLENIQLPFLFTKDKKYNPKKALELLRQLGFQKETIHQPTSKLSIGQQQRVALARALISEAKIILADEPTSALDEENRDNFLDLLFEFGKKSTIIYVSHDKSIAPRFEHILELGASQ